MTLIELVKAFGNIQEGKITKVRVWSDGGFNYEGEWEGTNNINTIEVFVKANHKVKRFDIIGKRLEVILY